MILRQLEKHDWINKPSNIFFNVGVRNQATNDGMPQHRRTRGTRVKVTLLIFLPLENKQSDQPAWFLKLYFE